MVKRIHKAGVAVEGRRSPLEASLPRMDVAGFVGFVRVECASQEAHEPLSIESASELERHFGSDLAVDGWQGQLGPSVRAFFANGGRRAVVVGIPASYAWTVRPERLVDARLAGLTVAQLREESTRLWAEGERLKGLHALLDIDDLTLVCMPDAAQAPPAVAGGLTLHVDIAAAPPGPSVSPLPEPSPGSFRPLHATPVIVSPPRPAPTWAPVESPRRLPHGASAQITLSWTTSGGLTPDLWEVQTGWGPTLEDSDSQVEVVATPSLTLEAEARERIVRVRGRWGAERGPWSGPARLHLEHGSTTAREPDPLALAALHRCLLRFALARGDVLALLTLPVGAGPLDVSRHLRLLDPDLPDTEQVDITLAARSSSEGRRSERAEVVVPRWSWDERDRVLSSGALYHPWVAHVGRAAEVVPTPPDGPVAGSIARRTLEAGCWIAPANRDLEGALGVHSDWLEPVWARWEAANPTLAARLNRLSSRAGGTRALRANTLQAPTRQDAGGEDAPWRGEPLTTRRLLALVRRLALREGRAWVFAPAGAGTAASMGAAFSRYMSMLFQGGAFAGATVDTSYEVAVRVVSAERSPRLEVDLRIAPARPMEFITIRLVQRDPRGLPVVEG